MYNINIVQFLAETSDSLLLVISIEQKYVSSHAFTTHNLTVINFALNNLRIL